MDILNHGLSGLLNRRIGALLLCLMLAGCSLIKLKKEVRESLASTVIVGRVSSEITRKGPIVVAAYSKRNRKREVAHYSILHDVGEYELMVARGDYYVFAFQDNNRNLVCDAGEPAGQYGSPKVVAAPSGGVVPNIDIAIPASNSEIDWPPGRRIAAKGTERFYSRQAGAIADLDDERFSDENGGRGFWEPVSFFKTFGGNVFFLEPYDPQKIPILFIHGAAGTPRGWKYFVDHIDRTRFQPWFFYYPSGARIRSMSYLLMWKLANLQVKYNFRELYITAHSMGGLVARSFLMDFGTEFPYVKLFVSLATPWGGDRMAEYGVKQSPAVIPCWIDMQPGGDFIRSLYREKLPDTISFYMFYGYRGSRNPFRSNNDGTITLSSLLDSRPQAEAQMNYAFNEDHASIIYSQEAVGQYNTLLNTFYAQHHASQHPSGGYIRINYSYDYPGDGVRPQPKLILRSLGRPPKVTITALRPEDNGRVLGPFPGGDYTAWISADGVKTRKKGVPLTIESRSTKTLDFVFTPDGTISAYIITAIKPMNRVVGMPAWKVRPRNNDIAVESITLTGPGTHRTLYPLEGENSPWADKEAARQDYCYKGYLRFFGLPAGAYELVIRARGHKTYVTRPQVTPGRETPFEYYELTPLK
jgi:pimeloyl-ACP methyl ester carboxylesterase